MKINTLLAAVRSVTEPKLELRPHEYKRVLMTTTRRSLVSSGFFFFFFFPVAQVPNLGQGRLVVEGL